MDDCGRYLSGLPGGGWGGGGSLGRGTSVQGERKCGAVSLNANRHVTGVLRGFDQFMNIVLDNAVDEKAKTDIGMVVSLPTNLPPQLSSYTSMHLSDKMTKVH
jgi:small nuclear ribonucleoprotein (snRNP)-like protein